MKRLLVVLAALAFGVMLLAGSASATPTISISDGTTTIVVTDGSLLDMYQAADGVVTWIGSIGAWSINVTTGLTKPVLGSAIAPFLEVNSIDMSTSAATLRIMFSETDFGPVSSGMAALQIGGTTVGEVIYGAWYDPGNALFGKTTPIGSVGPLGPGAYSGVVSGSVSAGYPFSITQEVVLNHTDKGVTSFNATLAVVSVPEPSLASHMLVAASGLVGLVGLTRRRRFTK